MIETRRLKNVIFIQLLLDLYCQGNNKEIDLQKMVLDLIP